MDIKFGRAWVGLGFSLSILIMLGVGRVNAQIDSGSISGTVRDQSGAVVPKAIVTLRNIDTGLSMTKATGGSGGYIFTPVKIGRYELEATQKGFETVRRTSIRVSVNQHVVVDFVLRPGSVKQTVVVTAPAAMLQTRSGSVGQVIGAREINDLPLNGRNFTFLAQLAQGTMTATMNGNNLSGQTSGSFIVNGLRYEQNSYQLDGIDNDNKGQDFGAAIATAYQNLPPVDGIAEFKLQTADYDAQFGRGAGAVLNAVTKSGTNQLHGDLWEFVRNDALDGQDFFLNAAGLPRAPFNQNQFGGTLGGPVYIPHVYDGRNKTFFFVDYEALRVRQAVPATNTVPSMAERNGDFSDLITGQSGALLGPDGLGRKFPLGTVFDPATTRGPFTMGQVDPVTGLTLGSACTVGNPCYARDPFPGNIVPASRMFSGSLKLLDQMPLPNLPGLFGNWAGTLPSTLNSGQLDIRIDHNFSPRDQFFSRYSRNNAPGLVPATFGNLNQVSTSDRLMNQAVAGWTHTFSASLINEAHLGWSRLQNSVLQPNYNVNGVSQQYGIPGIPQGNLNGGLPTFVISGLSYLGSGTWQPANEFSKTTEFTDDLTKIAGKHTFKGGFQYQHIGFPFLAAPFSRGRFHFSGQYTSIPGITDSSTGRVQFLLNPIAATVPDGINYVGGMNTLIDTPLGTDSMFQPYYAGYVEDDWKTTRRLTLDLGLRYDFYGRPYEKYGAMANLIPGVNWQGGQFEIPALRKDTPLSPSFLAALQKDNLQLTYPNNRTLDTATYNNFGPRFGLAYEITPKLVLRGGFGMFYGGADITGSPGYLGLNYPFEYYIIMNAPDPEHPLTPGATPGALSNGLASVPLNPALINSTLAPTAIQSPYQTPTAMSDNLTLQYQLTPNSTFSLGYVGTMGRHLDANSDANQPSVLIPPGVNPQPYVPYPDLSRNFDWTSTQANSYYHSLQTNFERRFSGGLDFLANYTWSKCRDDGGGPLYGHSGQNGQPAFYRALFFPGLGMAYDYGLCDWDTPQTVHFSGSYDLPFGAGKYFLRNSRGFLNQVVGGWSTNWILTLMSGQPATIPCAILTNAAGGCYAPVVPGVGINSGPHNISHYWNAAAFTTAPLATAVGQTNYAPFGGAPTQARVPGVHEMAFSVFKRFHISESRYFEFRAEAFNLTNTPQFGPPAFTNYLDQSSFGRIVSTRDAPNDQREIQLALKFYF